jgi:hypothetical protein
MREVVTSQKYNLDQQLFDLVLDGEDLRLEVGGFVSGDGSGDHRAADTTSTAQSGLGGYKHIRHVLIFAQQRKMQQDFKRFGIG